LFQFSPSVTWKREGPSLASKMQKCSTFGPMYYACPPCKKSVSDPYFGLFFLIVRVPRQDDLYSPCLSCDLFCITSFFFLRLDPMRRIWEVRFFPDLSERFPGHPQAYAHVNFLIVLDSPPFLRPHPHASRGSGLLRTGLPCALRHPSCTRTSRGRELNFLFFQTVPLVTRPHPLDRHKCLLFPPVLIFSPQCFFSPSEASFFHFGTLRTLN